MEHQPSCPRAQFWDAGAWQAPCNCDDQTTNPLYVYLEDFGIARYEQRTFMSVFVHYVNIREESDYNHSDTLVLLMYKVGHLSSHFQDACHDAYKLIMDQPELYW